MIASVSASLVQKNVLDHNDYEFLARYFFDGFFRYIDSNGTRAHYPGARSSHGRDVDGIEGVTRMIPLMAAWIASGRGQVGAYNLKDIVARAICDGVTKTAAGYWGDIHSMDQRIVEAADVALALWISRKEIWVALTNDEKNRISDWLNGVNGKQIPDNNWHLFVVLTNEILSSLGQSYDEIAVREHYTRLKSFYCTDGWFSDGPIERFDFYNAWAIWYGLLWLDAINPKFDHEFILNAYREFEKKYIYFFSPRGFPILGRSVCYRLALPAPLILAQALGISELSVGLTHRACDVIWQYFIDHGAICDGYITQGFWGADLRVVEHYSGPASPLWSLRSLVPILLFDVKNRFWSEPIESLPVELKDFDIQIAGPGWRLRGQSLGQDITIVKSGTSPVPRIRRYSLLARLFEWWVAHYPRLGIIAPQRPNNHAVAYDATTYSNAEPFMYRR